MQAFTEPLEILIQDYFITGRWKPCPDTGIYFPSFIVYWLQ